MTLSETINLLESELNDRRREGLEAKEAGQLDLYSDMVTRQSELTHLILIFYRKQEAQRKVFEGESEFEKSQREFESK